MKCASHQLLLAYFETSTQTYHKICTALFKYRSRGIMGPYDTRFRAVVKGVTSEFPYIACHQIFGYLSRF